MREPTYDWRAPRVRLADTEARMTAMLEELGLTALVTSIEEGKGVSALSGGRNCRTADTSHQAGSSQSGLDISSDHLQDKACTRESL